MKTKIDNMIWGIANKKLNQKLEKVANKNRDIIDYLVLYKVRLTLLSSIHKDIKMVNNTVVFNIF